MKRYILFILLACFFTNCNKSVIELLPISYSTAGGFYKSNQDFLNAVNATYATLQSQVYGNNEYMFGDLATDDAIAVPALFVQGHGEFDNYTTSVTSTNSGQINARWNAGYNGIMRANAIINRIEAITTIDATLKARYTAEAKYLRGVFYFQLVKIFGAVPLVLIELNDISKAYDYTRDPVSSIYTQIQKDLTDAATGLPASYAAVADKGRATSGAANAMLARVYMWQKNFTAAAPLLNTIISSGTYSLLPNYSDIFKAANGNNAEIIFAIQYTANTIAPGQANNNVAGFNPIGGLAATVGYFGTNANQPSVDLYNAYQTANAPLNLTLDPRRDININNVVIGGLVTYYVNKYLTPSVVSIGENGVDYPVIRLADVILMYAECLNEAGDVPGAIAQVNKVRLRAFNNDALQNLQSTDATNVTTYVSDQTSMRDMIMRERRLELAFEGLRFFDLVRTDLLLTTMNSYFIRYNIMSNGTIIVVGNNNKLYPVPQTQINLNPLKITQNPGY